MKYLMARTGVGLMIWFCITGTLSFSIVFFPEQEKAGGMQNNPPPYSAPPATGYSNYSAGYPQYPAQQPGYGYSVGTSGYLYY